MTAIQNGREELRELIRNTGHTMIDKAEETQQKRIIGTISQRLEDALGVLDSVEAEAAEQAAASGGKSLKEKAVKLLLHPAVSVGLLVCAMVPGVFLIALAGDETQCRIWAIRLMLVLALILARAVFGLVRASRKEAAREKPAAVAGIDLMRAKVTVTKLAGTMLGDSKAIAAMFAEEKRRAGDTFENEVIRMYSSLYEARIDNPEVEDLNYVITLAEMLLRKMGIREVLYTPEQENLFDIQEADYRDEMRVPALIREKTGEVVRKGEYIRNIGRR